MHEQEGASKASVIEETTTESAQRDRASRSKPTSLDVETAVELMLSAHNVDDQATRQTYRLHILKALPANAIDWGTVNWVQVWPFQTTRS